MTLISWNDKICVNVKKIDKQHKKLIAILNNLDEGLKQGDTKEILGKTILALVDYTFYHFMTEEKYFDEFGYPDTVHHTNEHNYFRESVSEFKEQYDQDEAYLTDDILIFLKSWVVNHIQESDKKYGSFFNKNGLD